MTFEKVNSKKGKKMKRMTTKMKEMWKRFTRFYLEALTVYGESLLRTKGFTCP